MLTGNNIAIIIQCIFLTIASSVLAAPLGGQPRSGNPLDRTGNGPNTIGSIGVNQHCKITQLYFMDVTLAGINPLPTNLPVWAAGIYDEATIQSIGNSATSFTATVIEGHQYTVATLLNYQDGDVLYIDFNQDVSVSYSVESFNEDTEVFNSVSSGPIFTLGGANIWASTTTTTSEVNSYGGFHGLSFNPVPFSICDEYTIRVNSFDEGMECDTKVIHLDFQNSNNNLCDHASDPCPDGYFGIQCSTYCNPLYTTYNPISQTCSNINECESGTHSCDLEITECVDNDNGYVCDCKASFIYGPICNQYCDPTTSIISFDGQHCVSSEFCQDVVGGHVTRVFGNVGEFSYDDWVHYDRESGKTKTKTNADYDIVAIPADYVQFDDEFETAMKQMYASEYYENIKYMKDLTFVVSKGIPGSSGELRLHFAEIWFNEPNKRIFNIKLEGYPEYTINNVDIFLEAGGQLKPIFFSFFIPSFPVDGIRVTIERVFQNPKASGYEWISVLDPVGTVSPLIASISEINLVTTINNMVGVSLDIMNSGCFGGDIDVTSIEINNANNVLESVDGFSVIFDGIISTSVSGTIIPPSNTVPMQVSYMTSTPGEKNMIITLTTTTPYHGFDMIPLQIYVNIFVEADGSGSVASSSTSSSDGDVEDDVYVDDVEQVSDGGDVDDGVYVDGPQDF